MPSIIPQCEKFLTSNAVGKWHETFRFKNSDSNEYIHPIKKDIVLLRVEMKQKRAFYWIYNINDAYHFMKFVGLELKAEAHEIIIQPNCRLFFDIDLKLGEFEKLEMADRYNKDLTEENEIEVFNFIGERIAYIFKKSIVMSLEEHAVDIDQDLKGMDFYFTMRNRALEENGFKISIHIITNLMFSLQGCATIVSHIKSNTIISNSSILGIDTQMAKLLVDSIDNTQYRRHGSLSLPYGVKNNYQNWIYKDYDFPNQQYFITVPDEFTLHSVSLKGYNIIEKVKRISIADSSFVSEALKHINNIPDYNTHIWDIKSSILKNSTMFVKRHAPSMCSLCERTHDNDNTLFLMFNSDYGTASWKCIRSNTKPIIFFRSQISRDYWQPPSEPFPFIRKSTSESKYNTPPAIDLSEDIECEDINPIQIEKKKVSTIRTRK